MTHFYRKKLSCIGKFGEKYVIIKIFHWLYFRLKRTFINTYTYQTGPRTCKAHWQLTCYTNINFECIIFIAITCFIKWRKSSATTEVFFFFLMREMFHIAYVYLTVALICNVVQTQCLKDYIVSALTNCEH